MWDRSTMCLRGARETAARVSAHAGGRVLIKESLVRDTRRGTGTPSRAGTSALRAVPGGCAPHAKRQRLGQRTDRGLPAPPLPGTAETPLPVEFLLKR